MDSRTPNYRIPGIGSATAVSLRLIKEISAQKAARQLDGVVAKIPGKDFRVPKPPAAAVCRECDLRRICLRDGTIRAGTGRRRG